MCRNAAGLSTACGILPVQFQKTKDSVYSYSAGSKGKQLKQKKAETTERTEAAKQQI
jgi:hypothetical protein